MISSSRIPVSPSARQFLPRNSSKTSSKFPACGLLPHGIRTCRSPQSHRPVPRITLTIFTHSVTYIRVCFLLVLSPGESRLVPTNTDYNFALQFFFVPSLLVVVPVFFLFSYFCVNQIFIIPFQFLCWIFNCTFFTFSEVILKIIVCIHILLQSVQS